MNHQVKSWFGAHVANVAPHPAVRALATKWLQIKTERDPCLADFWHDADETFSGSAILFLKSADDYVYLHHGRHLRERIGFSMQGLTLGSLRTRVRAQLVEIYDRCAGNMEPAYFQSFADFQQEVMLWGRLCLPLRLSAGDDRIAILLYCHPIEDKASIFRASFERAHTAMVIAAPVRDPQGTLIDAWIIAQNEPASAVTGIGEHATSELLLRSVPLFADDAVWSHLADQIGRGIAGATVTDEARGVSTSILIEAVDEYLVIRFFDPDVTRASFSRPT